MSLASDSDRECTVQCAQCAGTARLAVLRRASKWRLSGLQFNGIDAGTMIANLKLAKLAGLVVV